MLEQSEASSDLSSILARPIRWQDAKHDNGLSRMLHDLQANILKGHGRDHTGNVFVSFAGMPPPAIAGLLQSLAGLVTSAFKQLSATEAYKQSGVDGGAVYCVFLARGAYERLHTPASRRPGDPAFQAGMRARGQLPQLQFGGLPPLAGLNDPPHAQWGTGWGPDAPEPDAMVLVAGDTTSQVTLGLETIEQVLNGTGARVMLVERGEAQRRKQAGGNPKGEGLEHFGYVDGRSQPLFLQEDVDAEAKAVWNPAFPPSQFLVHDPARHGPLAFGSYFVFRKLEQNVKEFKAQEDQLADRLQLPEADRERAGAMVVGRWEDGTPVVGPSDAPTAGQPPNDFDYSADPAGLRCPFRGHIRKTNPRSPPPKPGDPAPPPGLASRAEPNHGPARHHVWPAQATSGWCGFSGRRSAGEGTSACCSWPTWPTSRNSSSSRRQLGWATPPFRRPEPAWIQCSASSPTRPRRRTSIGRTAQVVPRAGPGTRRSSTSRRALHCEEANTSLPRRSASCAG